MNNEIKLSSEYYMSEQERMYQNAIRFPFEIKPDRFMRLKDRLPEPFTIAVQKSKGEFSDGVMQWAQSYGFDYDTLDTRRLSFTNSNGSRLFLERSSDILKLLGEGNIDYGILGAEKVLENQSWQKPYIPIQPLCFGVSNFSLGFKDSTYPTFKTSEELIEFLASEVTKGKSIATSLPRTLSGILENLFPSPGYFLWSQSLVVKDGSIENTFDMLPDKICAIADIVDSGETCLANNIRADYRLIQIPGAFVTTYNEKPQINLEDDKIWSKAWNGSYRN